MKLLFLVLCVTIASADRIVKTTNGAVKGTSLSPKKVEAFLGIPYADPPVGPLRFAKPVPKSSWDGTYDAVHLPPTCTQASFGKMYFSPDPAFETSEDCLYLNLWVPEGGEDSKPVMLFIHGGGFMGGSSNMEIYNGANLAEQGDVIVATINYRVGTLGFFSGFVEDAPGNLGLQDQVMALRWIKDNAEHFGGDPDNIVLFGESAGGYSISMHMISPLSKGLFRRAILQSGSAANPMLRKNNGLLELSERIAGHLGCGDESDSLQKNPQAVIDCMRALPVEKFVEADAFLFMNGEILFFPRVGDSFLPEGTVDSLKKGHFKDTELLLGVTRDEGSILLAAQFPGRFTIFGEETGTVEFNETTVSLYLKRMAAIDGGDADEIAEKYFDRVKKEPGYTPLKAASDFVGDFLITCASVFHADYHSLADNPVYFYLFDYRPDSTPLAEWMGVAHFDEIQYVFGNPAHQNFTEYESEFSRDIMDMWVAFAKTGNPNIPGGVKWPQYTHKDPKYLVISKKDRVAVKPDDYRCESWRKIFETVIDEDTIQRLKKST